MSSFRASNAIQLLNDVNFFDIQLTGKFKVVFYSVLSAILLVFIAILTDTWLHRDMMAYWSGPTTYYMQQSITAKLYLPSLFNLLIWVLLILLSKSRKKATYYNYGLIMVLLLIMYVVNNYLIKFYSEVYWAKSGFMVFLVGFFLALPLHEKQKIIRSNS